MSGAVLRYMATAPRGLADLVARELRTLGVTELAERTAGVRFAGELRHGYAACLWSRVASRVLVEVADFQAPDTAAFYSGARGVDWSAHLRPSDTLACEFTGAHPTITHSQFGALKLKDAICDELRERCGARPDIALERPAVRVVAHASGPRVLLYVDLAGEGLHRRGYRLRGGEAPLRENLAAGILLRAGWPEMAAAGAAFLDPLCGSGTLPIEAALMAAGRAPGLQRDYWGFSGWRGHDAALWEHTLAEARARARNTLPNSIRGSDRDAAVLRVSLAGSDVPVEVRVEHARGSIARPLTDADLVDKADKLVEPVLGPSAAARIRDAVDALPGASDITGLLAVIRPAPEVSAAVAGAAPTPAPTAAPVSAETQDPAPLAPGAVPDSGLTTDAILALALAPPALADGMVVADQAAGTAKDSLALFSEGFTAGEQATVPQAIEAAAETGSLPFGHALTAFVRAASALAEGAEIGASTAIVCAAATALGENCAEAVAVGGAVTDLVAVGLPDAQSQGWSAEVVAAVIGGCVAAGLMLGLSESQLRAAIGIAATQAAGLSSAEGTNAGVLQAGKAAFNAVEAALLAQRGFTASDRPLEGRRGLYALFAK